MTTNDTLIVMTADQLKAIVNKTLKNAKNGKESNQTSLTDAAKFLGVDGNWGTALSKDKVIAPGVDLASIAAPSAPAQPSSFKVYLNGFDADGNFSMSVHATQKAADQDARNWLKEFKSTYPEVDYDQDEVDDVIEEMREISDYAIRVMQESFELTPPEQGPDTPENLDEASTLIEKETAAIEAGSVPYLECFMQAQLWDGDHAIAVQHDEDTSWNMTVEEALQLTGKSNVDDIEESSYDTDLLRNSRHAPEWVQNWDGPFEVEMELHEAKHTAEPVTAEDRVRHAADDAFSHILETQEDLIDLMDDLDMDPADRAAFRKQVVDLWMKENGEHFADRVDFEGTQIVNDNVYDETWGMADNELRDMLGSKNASKIGL